MAPRHPGGHLYRLRGGHGPRADLGGVMSEIPEILTTADAVAALNRIKGGDPEGAHADADRILLASVHPDIRAAWERVETRARGFWYA